MDPDIVADPIDLDEMHYTIAADPEWVWVAPHKLWPASTGREGWVWGHGTMRDGVPVMSTDRDVPVRWFALGFTYTPRALLDLAAPDMGVWEYGQVDAGLSRYARDNGIGAGYLDWSEVKHLHFYPREGDASWRSRRG